MPSGFPPERALSFTGIPTLDASLAARANAVIFGERKAPSLKTLQKKTHEPPLTFHLLEGSNRSRAARGGFRSLLRA